MSEMIEICLILIRTEINIILHSILLDSKTLVYETTETTLIVRRDDLQHGIKVINLKIFFF